MNKLTREQIDDIDTLVNDAEGYLFELIECLDEIVHIANDKDFNATFLARLKYFNGEDMYLLGEKIPTGVKNLREKLEEWIGR